MSYEDIPFLNRIRNKYAEEYLHDSRLFSLEETTEWFEKTNPDYLIISIDETKIGYARISNYSKVNRNLMVGVDISPEFIGKGYGKLVYQNLIPFLFEKYSLNKISLEVLSSNKRAIHLYEIVGFKHEGIKREEVYKNGKFIDSIVMSILKSDFES